MDASAIQRLHGSLRSTGIIELDEPVVQSSAVELLGFVRAHPHDQGSEGISYYLHSYPG